MRRLKRAYRWLRACLRHYRKKWHSRFGCPEKYLQPAHLTEKRVFICSACWGVVARGKEYRRW